MPWNRQYKITIPPHPELLSKTTKIPELLPLYEKWTRGSYTRNTIDGIKRGVRRLVGATGVDDIKKIDFELLNNFKNICLDCKLEDLTINGYLSEINCFLQFFGICIEIPHIPNRKGRVAKIIKGLWTVEQFERLLEVTPSLKYRTGEAFLYTTR